MERLLTVEEAAERLRLGRSMTFELIASQQLRSITIGRARRVREIDLDAFIQERSAAAPSLAAAV